MSKITYDNKIDLHVDSSIADINKVSASDMNEIKNVVNNNAEEVGDITSLTTTDKTSVVNAINEVKTTTDNLNTPEKWVAVGETAPTDGRRVWFKKSINIINPSKLPVTQDGITITKNNNGDIVLNGTPTIESGYTTIAITDWFPLEANTYTLSVKEKRVGIGVTCTHSSFAGTINLTLNDAVTHRTSTTTTTSSGEVRVNVNYNVGTLNNFILNPQLQIGATNTTFEPYVEPSINVDEEKLLNKANLVSVGTTSPTGGERVWFKKSKNLISSNVNDWANGNWSSATGQVPTIESSNGRISLIEPIKVIPNTTYHIKVYSSNDKTALFRLLDADKKVISTASALKDTSWTAPNNCYYICVTIYENVQVDVIQTGAVQVQLELRFNRKSL